MSLRTTTTANNILNRVAVEVGLKASTDPFSDTDDNFIQLRSLLNTAGEELIYAYPWELMQKEEAFTTAALDTGIYDLPLDFSYMINQTGWQQSQQTPLFGPLSSQDWAYLQGRDLASSTIYASFRFNEGKFNLFPQPPPVGEDISYWYMSKNWVRDDTVPATPTFQDDVTTGTQIVLYDKTLVSRFLKVKWYESKGFDTSKAQADFNQMFNFLTSKDKAAEILNAGRQGHRIPYLDTFRNLPDTGYGL